jgi:serine/threonine-protein phosphatase 2A regulatory subunit B''
MEQISQFSENVRYQIAKDQLEHLFLKWISQENHNCFVNKLIEEVHDPTSNILSPPAPIFVNKISTPLSPGAKGTSGDRLGGTIGHTPPRSPSGSDKYRTLINPVFEPMEKQEEEKDLSSRTLTQNELTKALKKTTKIPQFYYEGGKPVPPEEAKENKSEIEAAFGTKEALNKQEFMPITEKVFKFPKFLNSIVFNRLDTANSGSVSKTDFCRIWEMEYERDEVAKRMFKVIAKPGEKYLYNDDFKPLLRELLDTHPGLHFLQATPEFQDRYADTVVMRIFYVIDRNDDGRITYRDLKQSNFIKILGDVDEEEDINKIRDYFSYEHFYVLYCRFWELDTDHDFLIDKEDFSKYEGYALSRKTMDRIFDQIPRKFKAENPEKM